MCFRKCVSVTYVLKPYRRANNARLLEKDDPTNIATHNKISLYWCGKYRISGFEYYLPPTASEALRVCSNAKIKVIKCVILCCFTNLKPHTHQRQCIFLNSTSLFPIYQCFVCKLLQPARSSFL